MTSRTCSPACRRDRRRAWRILPAWLLLLASPAAPLLGQDGVIVGQPHPAFRLPRIDDRRPVQLSDYRGRKVLLIQFASW